MSRRDYTGWRELGSTATAEPPKEDRERQAAAREQARLKRRAEVKREQQLAAERAEQASELQDRLQELDAQIASAQRRVGEIERIADGDEELLNQQLRLAATIPPLRKKWVEAQRALLSIISQGSDPASFLSDLIATASPSLRARWGVACAVREIIVRHVAAQDSGDSPPPPEVAAAWQGELHRADESQRELAREIADE